MAVQVLSSLTTIANMIGLAASVCLAFYIVTRSPRSRPSWLAGLTLSLLACLFVYNAWGLIKPWGQTVRWLRPLTLLVLPTWFHLVLLLPDDWAPQRARFYLPPLQLPGLRQQPQGRAWSLASRVAVPLVYILALALMAAGVWPVGQLPAEMGPRFVLLSNRNVHPQFGLSVALLVVPGILALGHLWAGISQARNQAQRRQCRLVLAATTLAGVGGLYLTLGAWFRLPLPAFAGDLLVAGAAALLGYAVAEYLAWVEGRSVKQDLLYGVLAIGSLAAVCVAIAESLYLSGHNFSLLTVMVILIVAIAFLMLYDGVRTTWDRLFYRKQYQQLRASLRGLAREAGGGQPLPERLQAILHSLCRSQSIPRGLIGLWRGDEFVCEATEGGAAAIGDRFPMSMLATAEIIDLPQPGASGLPGMALLVPIYLADDQIGALVLGPKESGGPFTDGDRMLLENAAEQLATLIHDSRLQEQEARALGEMVADFRERERGLWRQVQEMLAERQENARPPMEGVNEQDYLLLVEDAMRRLHDYTYLGEHALARLAIVDRCLQGRGIRYMTHLDRGHAVSEVLTQALDKLRPPGAEPGAQAVPPRQWHPYLVLHDAYVLSEPNRDIMSRLYVGEGTFNRTRRHALRGVAKALQEMEQEAQQGAGRPLQA